MPNINNYDFCNENRHNSDRERPFITINSMHFKTIQTYDKEGAIYLKKRHFLAEYMFYHLFTIFTACNGIRFVNDD